MKSFALKSQNKILINKAFKSTNRLVEDFVIDTTNVIEISDGIKQSYTFSIIEPNSSKIENLVTIKQNEEYKSYFVEYYLTSEEMNMLYTNNTITNLTPDYITDLHTEARMSPSGPCVLHSFETELACNDANGNTIITEGDTGDGCVGLPFDLTFDVMTINTSCNSLSSGSGSSIDTGTTIGLPSGNGGGGVTTYSSNTPSDPNLLTTLVPPVKNSNVTKTPCENLKKHLSTTTGIKLKSPQIYNFLTSNLNQPKEYGFYFKKENNIYTPYPSYNATTDKITIQIGGTSFCSIHTHPYPSANPMFSWEDMYSLQQFFMLANQELLEEVTIYLVCTDNYGVNQLYAIKIDDFDGFTDFLNNDITSTVKPENLAGLTTDEDSAKEILKIMNKKQHDYNLINPNMNQEIPFLNYFTGSGASLYKANSTLTNWDKLTLSNNTTNPITKKV